MQLILEEVSCIVWPKFSSKILLRQIVVVGSKTSCFKKESFVTKIPVSIFLYDE